MPQFDFSLFPNQIFWALLVFGLQFWFFHKIALPKLRLVLEERSNYLQDKAEEHRVVAEEIERLKEHNAATLSAFYVQTDKETKEAHEFVRKSMDAQLQEIDIRLGSQLAERQKLLDQQVDLLRNESDKIAEQLAQKFIQCVDSLKHRGLHSSLN